MWVWWKYELESIDWDGENNTFTITNKYSEEKEIIGVIPFVLIDTDLVTQKVATKYKDSDKYATSDSALNKLRRGEKVIVGYDVTGTGEFLEYTYNDELDPGDYSIIAVTFAKPELMKYWQVDRYSQWFWHKEEEMSNEAEVYLLGRSMNSEGEFGEWETYAKYKNGEITTMNGATYDESVNAVQSNVFSRSEYDNLLTDGTLANPRGGTFCDLLPAGVHPDLESITVDNGTGKDQVVNAYVIENFRGSGRTMLIVKVSFDDHISYCGPISTYQQYSRDYLKYQEYADNYPKTGYKNVHKLHYTSVTKSVDPEVTVEYSEKVFAFRLTLKDKSGSAITDGSVYVELPGGARAELEGGVATFGLKAVETARINNVPAGAKYEIEETGLEDGWSLKEWNGPNAGTMSALGSVSATAVNTYVAEEVISGFASISAHKRLEGAELTSGAYVFELHRLETAGGELTDGTLIQSKTNSSVDTAEMIASAGGAETENPWYGTAPVRFEDLIYTEQGTYYYAIRETAGADETVDYDIHVEYVTVNVGLADGRLTAAVEYDGDGALFVNRLKTGTLRVEKTVSNATELAVGKEFTFTLSLKNRDGAELEGAYGVTIGSLDAGSSGTRSARVRNGGAVSIKGGEYFEVEELPHGTLYEVIETKLPGYERTEVNGEEGLAAAGTITAGETSTEKYVNYYTSTGTLNDRVNPVIRKEYEGGEIAPNQFRFELFAVETDGEGNEAERSIETAYANTDGTIFFRAFDYTMSDAGKTYRYRVYEIADEQNEEILYDKEPINLVVTLTDNGEGKLEAAVVKDRAAFTNKHISVVSGSLTVRKTVTGILGDKTREFEFRINLIGYKLAEVPEGMTIENTEGADGEYSIRLSHGESITLDLPAGTAYEIEEEETEGYTVKVTVDGEETAGRRVTGTLGLKNLEVSAVFENRYNAEVPTGAEAPFGETMLIVPLFGLAMYLIFNRRKREED